MVLNLSITRLAGAMGCPPDEGIGVGVGVACGELVETGVGVGVELAG